MDDEEFNTILFCPVCCTNLDAEGTGDQKFVCQNCGTEFSVSISKIIVQEFSIY